MMNILIADDDRSIRKMIVRFLANKGHRIFETADGLETYHSLMNQDINMAILDWILPGMSGIEICQKVRRKARPNYIFIIMLTIKNETKDLLEGFDAGVDEYIKKPVNLKELAARIKVAERIFALEQSLKQKQKELSDLNQMKNKFIGIAAHDLRNPIISIRGFSELLLKEPGTLSQDQREFLNIIHSTSRNMLAMLNDLLDISLIESGKLELSKKTGSLRKLILDRIQLNSLHAKQKRIAIHHNLENIPAISFDQQRLGQAVDNLITNAVKFTPYGMSIYISLRREGDRIRFSVRDEGPGIPADERHLLFSEFHRLSIQPTAGETSTGLGLAITKKIIEAHGGAIEVESKEGSGSTFSLILPIESGPRQKVTEDIHPPPKKHSSG